MDNKQVQEVLERNGYYLKDVSTHGSPDIDIKKKNFSVRVNNIFHSPSLADYDLRDVPVSITLNYREDILNAQIELAKVCSQNNIPFSYSGEVLKKSAQGRIDREQEKIDRITVAEQKLEKLVF